MEAKSSDCSSGENAIDNRQRERVVSFRMPVADYHIIVDERNAIGTNGHTLIEENDDARYIPQSTTPPLSPIKAWKLRTESCMSGGCIDDVCVSCESSLCSAAVCRICHSGEQSSPVAGSPLVSFCKCSGTMGLYHRECLEHWLRIRPPTDKESHSCEICHQSYRVSTVPPPLREFLYAEDYRTERRHLCADAICCFLLTPLAIISIIFTVMGIVTYYDTSDESTDKNATNSSQRGVEPEEHANGSESIEVPGLLMLAIFIITSYSVWLALALRYHMSIVREWRDRYPVIRVHTPLPERDRFWSEAVASSIGYYAALPGYA